MSRPTTKHFLLLATILVAQAAFANGKLRVMGYNVQNLFDTIDSPNTNDAEFTPNGSQHWTETVLTDKMRNLGEVIRESNADIVALSEVENQEVVERLVQEGLSGAGFDHVIAANSKDSRGIRTAVISRYPIVNSVSHDVNSPEWVDNGKRKYGRDILEVTVDTGAAGEGRYVTVLVNHWLSKGGGPIRDKWRADEARSISNIVRALTKAHPERLVIAAGDFNDTLDSMPISRNMPLVNDLASFRKSQPETFFPLDRELEALPAEQRGTHYFHPAHEWNTLDHLFVAEGASLKSGRIKGYHYVAKSVSVIHSRFVQHGGFPKGCEIIGAGKSNKGNGGNKKAKRGGNARFGGTEDGGYRTRCLDGASDHFPMVAEFEYR